MRLICFVNMQEAAGIILNLKKIMIAVVAAGFYAEWSFTGNNSIQLSLLCSFAA